MDYNYKQPNPKLELCTNIMTITLNSKDTYPHMETWIAHYAFKINKYIRKYFDFTVYFELSPKGRLHLHGTCSLKSYDHLIEWYLSGHKNSDMETNVKIDTIKDPKIWDTYIKKQKTFHEYLKSINLPHVLNQTSVTEYVKTPPTILEQFKYNL